MKSRLFACLAWVLLAPFGSHATAIAADARPNILFILTDDQSPETLRCYGNQITATPNLDRLAAEGMVIEDAHHMGAWSGAVCVTSRTMIMTGRGAWRVPGAHGPGLQYPKEFANEVAQLSMPAVFNRAGYATFRTCKVENSYNQANALFEVSRLATKREGNEADGSAWHADQVLEYLQQRESKADERPFLIYFGFSHPHDPRNARPELAAKYGVSNAGPQDLSNPQGPPLQANYLPEHPFPHGHPKLRDEVAVQGVMRARDEASIRNELGREYACIEDIDHQIGRVLDRLEEMGELENTYIFFTADHGIAVGRHGLMGKQNLYEHTWRVPMIVRGPGISAGSRSSGYVYLSDVFPTMCELAGIEAPESCEGRSFWPVLQGNQPRVRDTLYGVYCGGTKPGMRSVKHDGWKLIEYDVLDGKVRQTQLFNLQDNPQEFLVEHHDLELKTRLGIDPQANQVNLANDPQYGEKLEQMRKLLVEQMTNWGDPYQLSGVDFD